MKLTSPAGPHAGAGTAISTPPSVARTTRAVPIVLDWPIGAGSGAELLAVHLTLHMHGRDDVRVVPIVPAITPGTLPMTPEHEAQFLSAFEGGAAIGEELVASPLASPTAIGMRLLGHNLSMLSDPLPKPLRFNVGLVNTYVPAFDAAALERARRLGLLVAGSSWMRDVLHAAGLTHTVLLPPAVDTTVFQPGQKSGHLKGRFVIFAGGRMHAHKGQDLVLAAVKQFRKKHPETLLLTAWQTPWLDDIGDMTAAGHVTAPLETRGDALDVSGWAAANGFPAGSFVDLGRLSQPALAVALREADVAVFANRAETDLNTLVLECMATGVPSIVSQNTGHRDVATEALCYPLTRQGALRGMPASAATEGWGESSVEEIVAHLETVYAQSSAAKARAAAARQWVQSLSWSEQVPRLAAVFAPFVRALRS